MGDTHGNLLYLQKIIKRFGMNVDVIVQLGDFGFWEGKKNRTKSPDGFVTGLEHYLATYNEHHRFGDPLRVLWLDGNHESFDLLYNYPVRFDGVRPITNHIWHLPRGLRWEWFGKKFLAIGGANSMDRIYRQEGVSWWPQELITDEDVEKSMGGSVDYMLCHTVPSIIDFGLPPMKGVPASDHILGDKQQEQLQLVFENVTPLTVLHGHWHKPYHQTVRVRGRGEEGYFCDFYGLGCDGMSLEQTVRVVDLSDI